MQKQAGAYKRRSAELEKSLETYRAKFRRSKEYSKGWKRWADGLTPTKPREHSDDFPRDNIPTPETTSPLRPLTRTSTDDANRGTPSEVQKRVSPHPLAMELKPIDEPIQNGDALGSSQTTDDGDRGQTFNVPPPATETGNSSPVITCERTLKRKCGTDPDRVGQDKHRSPPQKATDGSFAKPLVVKEESSLDGAHASPLAMGANADSLDLDEIQDPVDTPRKRRHMERLRTNLGYGGFSQRSMMDLAARRSSSVPPERGDCDEGQHEHQNQQFALSFDDSALRESAVEGIVNGSRELQRQQDNNQHRESHDGALQQLSAHRRIFPWDDTMTRFAKQRNSRSKASKLQYFAEDGESLTWSHERPQAKTESSILSTTNRQRITGLLETPTTNKQNCPSENTSTTSSLRPARLGGRAAFPSPTRATPPKARAGRSTRSKTKSPVKQSEPSSGASRPDPKDPFAVPSSDDPPAQGDPLTHESKNTLPAKTDTTTDPRCKPANNPITVSRPDKPDLHKPNHAALRQKPLHALTPADFKLNPKSPFNTPGDKPSPQNPTPFAYHETVRGRAARACLPGCVRPECCGAHFRRMAEAEGANLPSARAPPRGMWDDPGSSPLDEEAEKLDEENRLLEGYLGRAAAAKHHVPCKSDGSAFLAKKGQEWHRERHEMIVRARTARLAQNHGRHRARFERRRTPPGFWRVEMPSTQEAEADRREVERMEREVVGERWREAVQGRGRWIFRDE